LRLGVGKFVFIRVHSWLKILGICFHGTDSSSKIFWMTISPVFHGPGFAHVKIQIVG
jgi:hypothetical protein